MKRRMVLLLALMLTLTMTGCQTQPDDPYADIPNPVATITMADGSIMRLTLYVATAPNTVANFVTLAQAGFYDGLEINYIYPTCLIRGGDPNGDGTGGPGYTIAGEFTENGFENSLSHTRGVISMARVESDNNSAGSQFFIMQGSRLEYDGKYAAFGKLADEASYLTLDAIAATTVDRQYRPLVHLVISSVTVDTFGYDYEVTKYVEPE